MLRLTVRMAVAALAAAALSLGLAATPAYAVAPDTTITSGPDGAYVLPGPVPFTFTSDQVGSTFECRIDDGVFAACPSPATYDLAFGTHFFRVRAVNGGVPDATPATRYWVVRNVPCEQAGEAYRVAQGKFFAWQQKLVGPSGSCTAPTRTAPRRSSSTPRTR